MKEINLELLQKFFNHQTNESECEIVIQWLEMHNLSKKDIDFFLSNPDRIKLFNQIDTQNDWEKVRIKLVPERRIIPFKYFIRFAASIAIILTLSGVVVQVYKYLNRPMVVYNYDNSVLNVMLPDSSWVSLNQNSKLIYSNSFSNIRVVTVEGQLFFEVKRNVHKPFVVNTSESSIKVLGTSFLVSTEKLNTKVIVKSGKVAFYATRKQCDTISLTKGDLGIYYTSNNCLEKQGNNDLNYLSWKTHYLSFNNTPLKARLCWT